MRPALTKGTRAYHLYSRPRRSTGGLNAVAILLLYLWFYGGKAQQVLDRRFHHCRASACGFSWPDAANELASNQLAARERARAWRFPSR